jgi:predicted NBD/HSP70 family sugar kinase
MSNLTDLHDKNISLLLQTLQSHGKVARYELADLTGLTRTTVSKVIAALIDKNVVRELEHGTGSSRGGRKPILLEICKDALAMIGIDLRREKVSGCLVDLHGDMLATVSYPIPLNASADMIWDTLDNIIYELKQDQNLPIMGIGIGSVGPLNIESGQLMNPSDFKSMMGARICDVLQERHGIPTILQIGAGAAAFGEYFWTMHDTARLRSLAFVVIDYGGIGIGMISCGTLVNNYGATSELGHVTIDINGHHCECGRKGCLRMYASGKALLKHISSHPDYARTDLRLSEIALQAEHGNETLQQLIVDTGNFLAHGVLDVDRMLSPERIVIGSSHEYLEKWYLQGIRQHLNNLEDRDFYSEISKRITLATKGSYAIAYGAATIQIKAFYEYPLAIINQLREAV